MKMYLNEQQTANLIELGFEKPSSVLLYAQSVDCDNNYGWKGGVKQNGNYSIGELIEMLPSAIEHVIWWGCEIGEIGVWGLRIDSGGTEYGWDVSYERPNSAHAYRVGREEMIDALFDMIVELKEEGVI